MSFTAGGGLAALVDAGLVPAGATPERVATGGTWCEGPVWVPADSPSAAPGSTGEVWWSDIPGNRVLGWSPLTRSTREVVTRSEFANGRTLDLTGTVVQCSHGRRAVETLVDDGSPDGSTRVVCDSSPVGTRLNSPNDVVVRSDGTVWFTDPPYGIIQPHEGYAGEQEYGDDHVFRFDPTTGRITSVVTDMVKPNGLAFSPDETLLYVADTATALGHGPQHHIRVYDMDHSVDPLGRCKNGRLFVEVSPNVPDGFRVDEHGNVWTSSGDGVQVFAPDAGPLGAVVLPEAAANLCFGGTDGRDLYVTATSSLYRIATSVRDAVVGARAGRAS